MLLCIFAVYLLAAWVIFYKLKLLKLDLKAKIVVFSVGVGIVGVVFFMVQHYAPYTKDVYMQSYVVPMAPQVGGRVTKVLVAENQQVAAGEPLFEVDKEPYRLRVDQLQAQLVEAQQVAFGHLAALESAQQSGYRPKRRSTRQSRTFAPSTRR